jgi:hypothetical protein
LEGYCSHCYSWIDEVIVLKVSIRVHILVAWSTWVRPTSVITLNV